MARMCVARLYESLDFLVNLTRTKTLVRVAHAFVVYSGTHRQCRLRYARHTLPICPLATYPTSRPIDRYRLPGPQEQPEAPFPRRTPLSAACIICG